MKAANRQFSVDDLRIRLRPIRVAEFSFLIFLARGNGFAVAVFTVGSFNLPRRASRPSTALTTGCGPFPTAGR